MTTGKVELSTNVKQEHLKEAMENVVRSKLGAGKDESEREEHSVYSIRCVIDLACDSITTSSDCGNKSLETGILWAVFKNMSEDGTVSDL